MKKIFLVMKVFYSLSDSPLYFVVTEIEIWTAAAVVVAVVVAVVAAVAAAAAVFVGLKIHEKTQAYVEQK